MRERGEGEGDLADVGLGDLQQEGVRLPLDAGRLVQARVDPLEHRVVRVTVVRGEGRGDEG